jgi:hypothetical protein
VDATRRAWGVKIPTFTLEANGRTAASKITPEALRLGEPHRLKLIRLSFVGSCAANVGLDKDSDKRRRAASRGAR